MTRDTCLDLFCILMAVAGACLVLGMADQVDTFLVAWRL